MFYVSSDGQERIESLRYSYHKAYACLEDALASIDDERTPVEYITSQLRQSMNSMFDYVLLYDGYRVSQSLFEKMKTVIRHYGPRFIPHDVKLLLNTPTSVTREELAWMAQVLDCWIAQQFSLRRPEYFNIRFSPDIVSIV